MQSQAAGGDAMPIRESKRDPPSLIAQLERDLAEQCAYIKAVEQQNRHLRAEAKRLAQAAAAQEQEREAAQALRAKVQRLEDAQRAHAETAAQLSALQQERAQWQRVFEAPDAPNAGSPFAVARTVADQRHALRALETRAAALQAACAEAEQHRVSAETRCEGLAAECARLRAQADAEAQRAARLDGARLHAVREAEFARAQLHSYDREEASMMPGNYDAHKALRIRQLEMFVDELRAWVAAADSGADADGARIGAVDAASAELLRGYREDAESARDDHRRLLERFEALEREAARLELQVGAGLGCDPRTTRILQLVDNPAARDFAIRSARLKALAAENAALLERLRGLEKGAGADPADDAAAASADNATAAPFFHSIDNLRSENQRLAEQLDVSAKMISRLKKEWKRKASELRDAIYSILGYRIDFLPNGSVRLTSMYAADVDQSFVFTSGDADQGIMHLSGGGSKLYLKSLANDIRFWLQERGSIPAFMATVTLQSFEEAQSNTAPE
ncbi:spindle assembly checkpoint component Mad1 [Kickxella alabastrina]|uniref:spindle assembly checkpoint component Mad1 n=1 Tax=Kickxella alabastrina TaxID=61397 RepID=UPI00221EF718|nr:spindle assembly checkpoint component Mad1 [Kickxella alabastrina]KAI7831876.1 spindle assembly checkpoint component Mad1 [Kickxella alabastrina]